MKQWLLASAFASCLCAFAQTPVISVGGVINGASFAAGQAVAPGSLVSIFGTDLAPQGVLTVNDTVPLSVKLSNVSVTFSNIPSGLYFVSAGQINVQVPWDVLPNGTTSGQAPAVVTNNTVKSAPLSVNIVPVAPGIFYLPNNGGYAIAINLDGSLAAPVNAVPGVNTHPAKTGDFIELLATGMGAVDSPIANGADSLDKLRRTLVQPTVLVGGHPSTNVTFSGLSPQFPGVNQINFAVPAAAPSGVVSLQLQAGGITTTDVVKMAVL